jgi:hypothetical protein
MLKFLIGFFLGGYAASKLIPTVSEKVEQLKLDSEAIIANRELLEAALNEVLLDLYLKGELEQKLFELTGIRVVLTPAIEANNTNIVPPIINAIPTAN